MTETLGGVSPSKSEELLEQPALAEAAVAGAAGSEKLRIGVCWPSRRRPSWRSRGRAGPFGPVTWGRDDRSGWMLKALTKPVIETGRFPAVVANQMVARCSRHRVM